MSAGLCAYASSVSAGQPTDGIGVGDGYVFGKHTPTLFIGNYKALLLSSGSIFCHMENEAHIIPAAAVKGIATGLVMMAVFTLIWSGIAYQGLAASEYWVALAIFPVFSVFFIVDAVRLYKIAPYYPKHTSEADLAEGKRMGKWFGIIFGAEGLGIFIGINIVVNLGHPELAIPVMALVVGLHFYPLAKVFKRTLDYYLATWSTVVAVLAIILTLNKTLTETGAFAFTGTGIAIATTCYGIYMVVRGRKLHKPVL